MSQFVTCKWQNELLYIKYPDQFGECKDIPRILLTHTSYVVPKPFEHVIFELDLEINQVIR